MTTDNITRAELFPAYLYIAPEGTGEDDTVNERYFAGPTAGPVDVCIRENVHNVRDMFGNTVCDIHYGGRLEIKGHLASVSPQSLALLFGAKDNGTGRLEIPESGARRRFSVCVVSPLGTDQKAFSLFLRTASASSPKLSLNLPESDTVEFTITSENSYGRSSASLSFAPRTQAVGA